MKISLINNQSKNEKNFIVDTKVKAILRNPSSNKLNINKTKLSEIKNFRNIQILCFEVFEKVLSQRKSTKIFCAQKSFKDFFGKQAKNEAKYYARY